MSTQREGAMGMIRRTGAGLVARGAMRMSVALCVASLWVSGCQSRHTGEQAQLTFAYDSPFDVENFNKPLMVGATMELQVLPVVGAEALEIAHTDSSEPTILATGDHVKNLFELRAVSEGSASVSVQARDERGDLLTDRVTMRTAKLHRLELSHACTEEARALYLEGTRRLSLEQARYSARGERLLGNGVYPYDISPKGAATLGPTDESERLDLVLEEGVQRVEVSSTYSDRALVIERVPRARITQVARLSGEGEAMMLVGEAMLEGFEPRVEGEPLCQWQLPIEARTLTPETCQVHAGDEQGEGGDEGWVTVRALAIGQCRYEVSFAGAAPGHARQERVRIGRLVFEEEEGEQAEAPSSSPPPPQDHSPRDGAPPLWLGALLALLAPLLLAPLWALVRARRSRA